jgi:hypothetical protein
MTWVTSLSAKIIETIVARPAISHRERKAKPDYQIFGRKSSQKVFGCTIASWSPDAIMNHYQNSFHLNLAGPCEYSTWTVCVILAELTLVEQFLPGDLAAAYVAGTAEDHLAWVFIIAGANVLHHEVQIGRFEGEPVWEGRQDEWDKQRHGIHDGDVHVSKWRNSEGDIARAQTVDRQWGTWPCRGGRQAFVCYQWGTVSRSRQSTLDSI